jgi:AcrR family transcriptional regulator
MARPRSEAKRNAILASAVRVFAKEGLSAPTLAVSRAAHLAEGTLFTYFPTKNQLLSAVFRDIRLELATEILSSFPRRKDVRTRLLHIWNRFVDWGVAHPEAHRVANQMAARPGLEAESSEAEVAVRAEFLSIYRDLQEQHLAQDIPLEVLQAALDALGEMTIKMTRRAPELSTKYRRAGFELLWRGLGGSRPNSRISE